MVTPWLGASGWGWEGNHCKSGSALGQAAQRGSGISLLGHFQRLAGGDPEQHGRWPCSVEEVELDTPWGSFRPECGNAAFITFSFTALL